MPKTTYSQKRKPCRGRTSGLATLPQENQEPLVVKDNVGRPAGELEVNGM